MVAVLAVIYSSSLPESLVADEPDLCLTAQRAFEAAIDIRGLNKKKAVPCLVKNRPNIKKYILETVERDIPSEKFRLEGVTYKALGLVLPEFSYVDGIIDLYVQQIGGYYDPIKDHFVMATWIPATFQFSVAVHELTHALQDQHFNLSEFVDSKNMTSDQAMARSALVEGDATAVMIDYSLRQTGAGHLRDHENTNMFMAQNVMGARLMASSDNAPQAILNLMIFPYTSGLRFAHTLIKKGDYKQIDSSFKNPPNTTEEILHPDKYLLGKIDFKDLQIEADQSYGELKQTDRLGEFFLSVWLNTIGAQGYEAAKAAAGWGGDQLGVFKKGENYTVVWEIAWDSDKDRDEFISLLSKIWRKNFDQLGGCFTSMPQCRAKMVNTDKNSKIIINLALPEQ